MGKHTISVVPIPNKEKYRWICDCGKVGTEKPNEANAKKGAIGHKHKMEHPK